MSTRTKRTLAVVGVAALAVTGGTVAASAADLPVPGQPAGQESAAAVEQVDERQQWADEVGQTYLDQEGANSIDALIYPFNQITGWESPAPGELVIRVDDSVSVEGKPRGGNMANRLQGVAAWVETQVEPSYPELESVTIATENGEWSVSADYWSDQYRDG